MIKPEELYRDYMKDDVYLIRWIRGKSVFSCILCSLPDCDYIYNMLLSSQTIILISGVYHISLITDQNYDLNNARNKLRTVGPRNNFSR